MDNTTLVRPDGLKNASTLSTIPPLFETIVSRMGQMSRQGSKVGSAPPPGETPPPPKTPTTTKQTKSNNPSPNKSKASEVIPIPTQNLESIIARVETVESQVGEIKKDAVEKGNNTSLALSKLRNNTDLELSKLRTFTTESTALSLSQHTSLENHQATIISLTKLFQDLKTTVKDIETRLDRERFGGANALMLELIEIYLCSLWEKLLCRS